MPAAQVWKSPIARTDREALGIGIGMVNGGNESVGLAPTRRFLRLSPLTAPLVTVRTAECFFETMAEVTVYLLAAEDADQTTDEMSGLVIHSYPLNGSPRRLGVGPNLPGASLLHRARSANRAVGDAVRRAFPPLSPWLVKDSTEKQGPPRGAIEVVRVCCSV